MRSKDKDLVQEILSDNHKRTEIIDATFNPYTGEGSTGNRVLVRIKDFPGCSELWLPEEMLNVKLIKEIVKRKSLSAFITQYLKQTETKEIREKVLSQFIRTRSKYDFPFWAVFFCWIRPKKAGSMVRFSLSRPQRLLVENLEWQRKSHRPIRIVLLKARQWGGSTCIQMYMSWLQLVHFKGANSAIEAHLNGAASNIQMMFRNMLDKYPIEYLYEPGATYNKKEKKFCNDPIVKNVIHVPARECSIQVGSAMNPDSSRSFNVSLAHCSEVAIWKDSDQLHPKDLVNAVCSGISLEEGTFIAYESTAKGEENFFHDEYTAAKIAAERGEEHEFLPFFISWYQIPQYSRPFKDEEEKRLFVEELVANKDVREAKDSRHEPGSYLWWLWEKGATLEAIYWYVFRRTGYSDHADMANEYPSDDIEAFRHSGSNVFDVYDIEQLRPGIRDPKRKGELYGLSNKDARSLKGLRFKDDPNGHLLLWSEPEKFEDCDVTDRYLVTVDIGGRWAKADWSVITVFDRYWMIDGGKPEVVAQWYGHIDHDLLAWKAAQIAKWYNDALLVIESNTLETKDPARNVDGDQSIFILEKIKSEYDNLYAREQSPEDIRQGLPRKFGFHTNVNTKPTIISHLIEMVRDNAYIERYAPCLSEFKTYQLNDGVYEAAPNHHDDLLMTRAIGLYICFRKMPFPTIVEKAPIRSTRTGADKTESSIV